MHKSRRAVPFLIDDLFKDKREIVNIVNKNGKACFEFTPLAYSIFSIGKEALPQLRKAIDRIDEEVKDKNFACVGQMPAPYELLTTLSYVIEESLEATKVRYRDHF
jgi:hypothetical protein